MDTTLTISAPEIALFDKTYLETMIRTFIKTLAQGVQPEEAELSVLTAAELADSCSVEEAEQGTLDIIHHHFHPAV